MKANWKVVAGVVLLIVFGVVAVVNLGRTVTPYVSFAEARTSGRVVQVAGFPDHPRAAFDPASGTFRFEMNDGEGDVMTVVFDGAQPGNFDQAQSVVVIGKYQDGSFLASRMLVKCPSKYESRGAEHPGQDGDEGKDTSEVADDAMEPV